jgi:hypothetical protein
MDNFIESLLQWAWAWLRIVAASGVLIFLFAHLARAVRHNTILEVSEFTGNGSRHYHSANGLVMLHNHSPSPATFAAALLVTTLLGGWLIIGPAARSLIHTEPSQPEWVAITNWVLVLMLCGILRLGFNRIMQWSKLQAGYDDPMPACWQRPHDMQRLREYGWKESMIAALEADRSEERAKESRSAQFKDEANQRNATKAIRYDNLVKAGIIKDDGSIP